MQILEAVHYAELEADVSATQVSRIALVHDRVTRVVHGLDGFAVEHDPASGPGTRATARTGLRSRRRCSSAPKRASRADSC